MTLTLAERQTASFQLAQLADKYTDRRAEYERHKEAVERGHTNHFQAALDAIRTGYSIGDIDPAPLSADQCGEVEQILKMFRDLQKYNRGDVGVFPGFDPTAEAKLVEYVAFLTRDGGEFADLRCADGCKADRPKLGDYRTALKKWSNGQSLDVFHVLAITTTAEREWLAKLNGVPAGAVPPPNWCEPEPPPVRAGLKFPPPPPLPAESKPLVPVKSVPWLPSGTAPA